MSYAGVFSINSNNLGFALINPVIQLREEDLKERSTKKVKGKGIIVSFVFSHEEANDGLCLLRHCCIHFL